MFAMAPANGHGSHGSRLEYACHTGNMGLAKLCYRRGAHLSAKTQKGETAFNIVTQNKRYETWMRYDMIYMI